MNYDEVMSKVEEILSIDKLEDYKISDKYFYYCQGYIDALQSQKVLPIHDYMRVKEFIKQERYENNLKEE